MKHIMMGCLLIKGALLSFNTFMKKDNKELVLENVLLQKS